MSVTAQLPALKDTLQDTFGLERLRPGQEQVIRSMMEGHDTLAIMSTGAGKSLCYQLPALHLEGTTVIVSPLISLMKDQVEKLSELGLDVAQLNSALSEREQSESLERITRAKSEFVFATPERLTDQSFIDALKKTKIDMFVIDEAHCLSEWGHDFRPAYLHLKDAIKAVGRPPILALTATATEEVAEDIKKQLGAPGMRVISMGLNRPNLRYEVIHVTSDSEKRRQLAGLLKEIDGTGIIYAATIKHVEAVTEFLKSIGFEVASYHGKLAARVRKETQDRFMAGELKAIVATNAFGMGIDKPDIRHVIHYNMPGSLEAYYQESGRAGRDGAPARCILLYQLDDRRTQIFFLGGRYPGEDEITRVYEALARLGADEKAVGLSTLRESASDVPAKKTRVILSALKDMKLVRELRGARLKLLRTGLSREEIERLARQYEDKSGKDRKKLEQMMLYAQSGSCRWKALLEYFNDRTGEMEDGRCGSCDNCVSPPEEQIEPPRPSRSLGWLDL